MSKTPASFQPGYALLIGVGNYPHIHPLPITVNDATALYQLFTDPDRAGYQTSDVRLLTNEQASRQGIIDGLDWLIVRSAEKPNATVVVYFSGHGGKVDGTYNLLPYDFKLSNWVDVTISKELFAEKIGQIKSRRLLVFLDCCHAAGLTGKQLVTSAFIPSHTELYQQLNRGKGRVIVASCRPEQQSYIYPGAHYSAFTNALIDALDQYGDNGNGYATVLQTLAIVSKVTVQTSGHQQIPVFDLSSVEDFPICRINTPTGTRLPFKKTSEYLDSSQNSPVPSLVRHELPVKPAFFLGREDLLKEVHQKLTDLGMRENIILLSGIGGMGKTTVMQEYVRSANCQTAFDRIIFSSVKSGIKQAIAEALIQALELAMIAPDPLLQTEKSFQFIIKKLAETTGTNLFIVDNVNEKNHQELKAIKIALASTGWKFLITTRSAPEGFARIGVDELDMADAELLFAYHFAQKWLDLSLPDGRTEKLSALIRERAMETDLHQLLEHIVKHTLLTELLAKAAAAKGLSPAALLDILKTADLKHTHLQRTISIGSHAENTHREQLNTSTLHHYLLSLFETEYLETSTGNESEDQENKAKAIMLRFFSVLPSTDLPISDLKSLWRVGQNEENTFEDRLEELRQIGWLQGRSETAAAEWLQNLLFKMHPLVQEVVYDKLKPDLNNCLPLIQTITEALNKPGQYPPIFQNYATGVIANFDHLKEMIHGRKL